MPEVRRETAATLGIQQHSCSVRDEISKVALRGGLAFTSSTDMNSPEISIELAFRLGVEPASISFLRYSQNFVYGCMGLDGEGRILRLTSDSHRTAPEICDELDWVCHLHEAGLSVCPPVAGEDGSLLRSFASGGEDFHAVLFEKANGRPLSREDLTPTLYRSHGRKLGAIHRVSKGYATDRLARRKPWDEERYFTMDIRDYLPARHGEALLALCARLRSRLNSAARNEGSFGAVHLDLGYSNFHLDGDRLEVFDFDNCTAGYYAGDVAAALYSSVFNVLRREFPGDRSAFELPKSSGILAEVLVPFREGYRAENEWLEEWDGQLQGWLDALYFRSVVHAWRLLHGNEDPAVRAALNEDIENLLDGNTPVRYVPSR